MSVKLQHDACNCWGVNMLTRQPDLEQVWNFKKAIQRSTSNLSKIMMCRILLSSYNLIQAIYEELSHSQGPPTCCLLESLKRSHKDQDQTWLKFWWVRTSLPVKLHDAGKFWCISIFTRSSKMLLFEHDLVRKVKRSDKGQHRTRPRFWCVEYLCKITKWYW